MVGEPKQASSATTAVLYVTVGALMAVWSAVYYVWLGGREGNDMAYLLCYGFFFSGLVLCGIGIAIGRIARTVRDAEVTTPPVVHVNAPAGTSTAPGNAALPPITTAAVPQAIPAAQVNQDTLPSASNPK